MKLFFRKPLTSEITNGVIIGDSYNAAAHTQGENSIAIASGPFSSASTSGENSIAIASGICSQATVMNADGVAIAWGMKSKAKGVTGSTLIFRDSKNGRTRIVTKYVDGCEIKADTFYHVFKNEIVEA